MLFMVIENFRQGDPAPVYQRFRKLGRQLPDGVECVDSWVSIDLKRCFQVMRCSDAAKLQEWVKCWADLVDFEIVPVTTSAEASALLKAK